MTELHERNSVRDQQLAGVKIMAPAVAWMVVLATGAVLEHGQVVLDALAALGFPPWLYGFRKYRRAS